MTQPDHKPDYTPDELHLLHRTTPDLDLEPTPDELAEAPAEPSRLPRNLAIGFITVLVLLIVAFYSARIWARNAMRDSLPQLDGSIAIPGLSAPVTVQRDSHGVPSIRAASLDDLILAQGYVTAQDRLWQMETLRRHASGTLAELFGAQALFHDRTQRTLQLRAAADLAVAVLPADQLHWLELYARGVNASIADQHAHLPLEFRVLNTEPAPWAPRDSLMLSLVMFQDLTTSFPTQLSREAISARLPANLAADLYPVGSWRDHPPAQPQIDLTVPQENIPDVPLDESQSKLTQPPARNIRDLIALQKSLTSQPNCDYCLAGSNNWAVSGAHTASGKPILSNDMHLSHGVPGIWYETSLSAPTPSGATFHVAGVALPGAPFIIVGHNDHIAWGFTNLGADVQEVYVEHTRTTPQGLEFQSPDGTWHPVARHTETIHVRGSKDVVLDVFATRHGNIETPVITPLLNAATPTRKGARIALNLEERRTLALAWTIYDPANVNSPFYSINSATDWASLTSAFSTWGGPAQNMVYADDQGHIGYHTVGKIPIRGDVTLPSPISPFPVNGIDPSQQWAGYIPFEQLPQIFDPPSGIVATANARITPDLYPFPLTLNWSDPYRNERIWKVLSASSNLTPADMLKLQMDVYSDVDHVLAQRFAYAIDHAGPHTSANSNRLHQAADLLRNWNGNVDVDSPAANIVDTARAALWPMLLAPKLNLPAGEAAALYTWGEKTYAEEQIILHAPDRWLPSTDTKWDDLLAAAVDKALTEAHAPQDLTQWPYGKTHTLDIEHPVFSLSPLIDRVLGVRTGTGALPQSGDGTTVKQVGHTFGPSERFTVDFSDLDHSTLNLVLGQSGDPLSPWFMDQFSAWYKGTTNQLPFTTGAVQSSATHTVTLSPK